MKKIALLVLLTILMTSCRWDIFDIEKDRVTDCPNNPNVIRCTQFGVETDSIMIDQLVSFEAIYRNLEVADDIDWSIQALAYTDNLQYPYYVNYSCRIIPSTGEGFLFNQRLTHGYFNQGTWVDWHWQRIGRYNNNLSIIFNSQMSNWTIQMLGMCNGEVVFSKPIKIVSRK